jgi:hypothetical protein
MALPTTTRTKILSDLATPPCDGIPENSSRPSQPPNMGPESPPTLVTMVTDFYRLLLPVDLLLFRVSQLPLLILSHLRPVHYP